MKVKVWLCCIFVVYFISACAQNLNESHMRLHSFRQKLNFLCNKFEDSAFEGYVWSDNSFSDGSCIYLYITQVPQDFFSNRNKFFQFFPFFIANDDEIGYGNPVVINTVPKIDDEKQRDILMASRIIDAHLVENLINYHPDSFFKYHLFKICDIEQHWLGLQLTLYERKIRQDPSLLGVTKFLLPPFLINPDHFRRKFGDSATVFHPLFNKSTFFQSVNYTGYAEDMCNQVSQIWL